MSHDQLVTLRLNGQFYGETNASELQELRVDINIGEWNTLCRDCRSVIEEYPHGWQDWNGQTHCGGQGDGTLRPHIPQRASLAWCERALITTNLGENSITARIDLPGAAFCLTIKQEPDGTLTLHLPHPDHASTRKLTEQAPGVYAIRN